LSFISSKYLFFFLDVNLKSIFFLQGIKL
jgi:hypothetical protein